MLIYSEFNQTNQTEEEKKEEKRKDKDHSEFKFIKRVSGFSFSVPFLLSEKNKELLR